MVDKAEDSSADKEVLQDKALEANNKTLVKELPFLLET